MTKLTLIIVTPAEEFSVAFLWLRRVGEIYARALKLFVSYFQGLLIRRGVQVFTLLPLNE